MNRDLSRRSAFGAKADRDRKLEEALKHELRAAGTLADEPALHSFREGGCVDAETLGAWADGGLDAVQMAAVELHVANCARCQAIVGMTAKGAPVAPVLEAPAGSSLWKWWLAPVAAGAAAVTLWMVIPQDPMQAPPAPSVTEAKKDAPATTSAAKPDVAIQPGRDERKESRDAFLERKQENAAADRAAIGAAAAPPPAAPLPAPAAPPVATARAAEPVLQKGLSLSAPLVIESPDSRRRWRVNARAIERSEDAGTTWIEVHQLSSIAITGGTALSGTTCWLIGANGAVLVTTDGATFAQVSIPERIDLTGITATDGRSAVVTAVDGRRFRTDDAGRTWRPN